MTKIYLPDVVGAGYGKFWRDKSRYRVLKGGKGSKKSATTALNFIYRLMKYPESNLLVVRAVMNTHRDSTFAQLKWAQERLGVSHLWQNNVSPMEMTYTPTGQKILFRGFDDVLKLASTTVSKGWLCWVWIEEAFELPDEADFDKLDLSVPRGNIKSPLFKQTTLTFNPWSEKHWLKRRFFDTAADDVSTYSTNYLVNEFLDDTDRAVFERMKETNYRKYAVAGLGEWGIAEGLIFENWVELEFELDKNGVPVVNNNPSVTFGDSSLYTREPRTVDEVIGNSEEVRGSVCSARDVNNNPSVTFGDSSLYTREPEGGDLSWRYRHFFGLDFGYTNDPTAFIAFIVNPIDKEIFIYDEHYETKMLNSDIAEMIKRKGLNKERIRADCAEPKSIEDLRRMGISRVQASVKGRDSIINGITQIQEYRIYVHPRCKNTIHELSSYRWKTDTSQNGINEPEDSDNHLMDALRYAFYDVRFFKPCDPNIRHRTTPQERFNRANGIRSQDVSGNWNA